MKKLFILGFSFLFVSASAFAYDDNCVLGLRRLAASLQSISQTLSPAMDALDRSSSFHEDMLNDLELQSGSVARIDRYDTIDMLTSLRDQEDAANLSLGVGAISMAFTQASINSLIETCRSPRW